MNEVSIFGAEANLPAATSLAIEPTKLVARENGPDLVIEVLDRAVARAIITGRMPALDAKTSEHVRLKGDPRTLEDFLRVFAMDPIPGGA